MTDRIWPVDIIPGSQEWGIVDNVGSFQSPLSGSVRTVSRPGARMGCRISVPLMKGQDRARVLAAISGLRQSDRIWMTDYTSTARGSMSHPELFTNNDFSNGTNSWAVDTEYAFTVSDQVAILKRTVVDNGQAVLTQSIPTVAYAPYAIRALLRPGSGTFGNIGVADFTNSVADIGVAGVLRKATTVPSGTAITAGLYDAEGSGFIAGNGFTCPFISASRCALIDNGPNALLYSDQIDNAAWTLTGLSAISANNTVAPDGTVTADLLNENGASSQHFVSQDVTVSSSAADYCLSVCVKPSNRSWCRLQVNENTGVTSASCYFNATTGAVGTSAVGANWANIRTFVTSLGNGWYRFSIVARKTNAATSLSILVAAASADNTATYTGGSFGALWIWRAVAAQSSVPTRGAQTTTTATTGTAQTGSGLYLKGLPASTSGLKKAGDPVSIGGQINFLTADLDSNAAGLGYMQCALPWRTSPADNDPVIFNTPMALMRLAGDIRWTTGPGQFSGFELDLVEDVT